MSNYTDVPHHEYHQREPHGRFHRLLKPLLSWKIGICVCVCVLVCLILALSLHTSTDISPSSADQTIQPGILQNESKPRIDAGVTKTDRVQGCLVRTWPPECIGYIAVSSLVGFVAFALSLPCILAAMGFGLIGITAGTLAACFQSRCGTPCCFSSLQSMAMLGVPWPFRLIFGVPGLILGGLAGAYWLPMCFTEEGSPVYGLNNYTSAIVSEYDLVKGQAKDAFDTSFNYTSAQLDPLWNKTKEVYENSYNYTATQLDPLWNKTKEVYENSYNYTSQLSSELNPFFEKSLNYTSTHLDPLWGHVNDAYKNSLNWITHAVNGCGQNHSFVCIFVCLSGLLYQWLF